eukprot:936754-Rhodomonas_salina.11
MPGTDLDHAGGHVRGTEKRHALSTKTGHLFGTGRRHALGAMLHHTLNTNLGHVASSRSAFGTYGADASGLPSDTAHTLARYSSQGPTADFRFKPEVLLTAAYCRVAMPCPAMLLRAMSTKVLRKAMKLRSCYALSGTEVGYAAKRLLRNVRY